MYMTIGLSKLTLPDKRLCAGFYSYYSANNGVSGENCVLTVFFAYFESKLPESQHMMLGFAKHYRQRQKNNQKMTDHSPQIRI